MSKKFFAILAFIAVICFSVQASDIKLVPKGNAAQLSVDGAPMLILGGELGNSSASCAADIESIFPKLRRMNLNTVLVPAYWDMIEPVEGQMDYSLTEKVIDEAVKNNLKVVFLWFGAWKNSMSCYAPEWFKADWKKYPRACTKAGKPLEIASAFSENVFRADSTAFSRWLTHVDQYDKHGTVLMIQIENEIGMLEDARDYSAAARCAYDEGVPAQLISFISKNKKSLHPSLLNRWKEHGMKKSGSWAEVFGDDIYTDEYFMAWNYARYVERLARTARAITSRPLYVNAAMNSRGRKPGEYPSAGPLAHLKDIWHSAAPSVDFLSPDLYDKGFIDWIEQYSTPDNVLFVPEIRRFDGNAAQAFYVIGEKDAIGLSPFSIENGSDSPDAASVKGYALLDRMQPLLLAHQGDGSMNGLYFDNDSIERVLYRDGMKITANHYFTLPWDPRATDGSEWPTVGGVIIRIAPREYIVAGSGLVVKFEDESETAVARKLGEDGFLDSGDDRKASEAWKGTGRIGLASVDEVDVNPDGSLKFLRRFNGDETHQGRHVRIGVDDFKILHVKLYDYK